MWNPRTSQARGSRTSEPRATAPTEAAPDHDLANTKAQRLQRSRAQFIGIALALASHFDDPLGDDLPD
jgi:hypothetical protein